MTLREPTPMSTELTSATKYVGWHRLGPNLPWHRIAEAPDQLSCWRLMRSPPGGDKVVLPVGEDPNIPKRPR